LFNSGYSDKTREFIARALAVREARYLWPVFVKEYLNEPIGSNAKEGLAVALMVTVTDATMEEFVALAKDRRNGPSRLYFLRALKRSKNPIAKEALAVLASDPDLEKEIASWRPRKPRRKVD
jgi:hypothetical protein